MEVRTEFEPAEIKDAWPLTLIYIALQKSEQFMLHLPDMI